VFGVWVFCLWFLVEGFFSPKFSAPKGTRAPRPLGIQMKIPKKSQMVCTSQGGSSAQDFRRFQPLFVKGGPEKRTWTKEADLLPLYSAAGNFDFSQRETTTAKQNQEDSCCEGLPGRYHRKLPRFTKHPPLRLMMGKGKERRRRSILQARPDLSPDREFFSDEERNGARKCPIFLSGYIFLFFLQKK